MKGAKALMIFAEPNTIAQAYPLTSVGNISAKCKKKTLNCIDMKVDRMKVLMSTFSHGVTPFGGYGSDPTWTARDMTRRAMTPNSMAQ